MTTPIQLAENAMFPRKRLRRLRQYPWLRELLAQTRVTKHDLIWPVFVCDEHQDPSVTAMPGVRRYVLSELSHAVKKARDAGIMAVLIFPVVDSDKKTNDGCEACNPDNILCRALRQLRRDVPDIGLWADVGLDPYTTHGHDGVLQSGCVVNDASLDILSRQARVLAQAGAHAVTPSDMMDGNVQAIRGALDACQCEDTLIISYAVKFVSSFYGPFRSTVGAMPLAGLADKRTYQVDWRTRQYESEVAMDVAAGSDILIIKPGLPYLDVIAQVCRSAPTPVLAYQVSGEYAMLHHPSLSFPHVFLETLHAFKRAGVTGIITYGALDACSLLA